MRLCALLILVITCWAANAGDGKLEINQACAENEGCFAGDTGGFPVTIDAHGSYLLTSELIVPASTSGVVLNSDNITLDLNGFAIIGPAICDPGNCPGGSGTGIDRTDGNFQVIRNGTVRGFLVNCVEAGADSFVSHLIVRDCANIGITAGPLSTVADSHVSRTGLYGIVFFQNTGIYKHNAIAQTGTTNPVPAVFGGQAISGNYCEDASCSTVVKKRFYLTPTTFDGNEVLTACTAGYHMAAFYEIFDWSNFQYDSTLGESTGDEGSGPPSNRSGWIRTGFSVSVTSSSPGQSNCALWTSEEVTDYGSLASLWYVWSNDAGYNPWRVSALECNELFPVWCAQD